MSKTEVPRRLRYLKATVPSWLRGLSMIFGFLCVILTVFVLSYPNISQLTQVLMLITALLIYGLARIIIGLFGGHISVRLREFSVASGIFVIVVTLIAIINQLSVAQTLIGLLSIMLLFQGVISAIIGRFAKTLPDLVRGTLFALGLLSISSSVVALLLAPLPFSTSIGVLSVGYLSNGITLMVESALKTKRSK